MHRTRLALITAALVLGMIVQGAGTSSAHPLSTFTLCAAHQSSGGECFRNASYLFGDTVFLRGELDPPHAWMRAQILRKRPHVAGFRRVGTADITPAGHVRWSWHTTMDDAVQDAPYKFRLRLKDHGVSNTIKVFVLFGE